MCAKYIANQHKHPQTPKQTPRFIQYKNDYIAWALVLLDQQRQTLADHMQRIQSTFAADTRSPAKQLYVRRAQSATRQPKPKRHIS